MLLNGKRTHALLDVDEDLVEALAEALGLRALLDEVLLHANVLGIDLGVAATLLLSTDSEGRFGAERERGPATGAVAVEVTGKVGLAALDGLDELVTATLKLVCPLALVLKVLDELLLAVVPRATLVVDAELDLLETSLAQLLALLKTLDDTTHAAHLAHELALAHGELLLGALELLRDVLVALRELAVLVAQVGECGG